MLPKRLFLGSLLLTAVIFYTGCAATGQNQDLFSSERRNALDECIRFGHRKGTYDFNSCMAKRMNLLNEIRLYRKSFSLPGA